MELEITKSAFKAKALEVMRIVEESGEGVIITSHGKRALVIKPYQEELAVNPLEKLKGSVISFSDPLSPVSDDDWEAAQ